jgi:hypothetical protein
MQRGISVRVRRDDLPVIASTQGWHRRQVDVVVNEMAGGVHEKKAAAAMPRRVIMAIPWPGRTTPDGTKSDEKLLARYYTSMPAKKQADDE